MKIVTLILMAAGLLLAQSKDPASTPKTAASDALAPAGVPKGATRVETNLYRLTDAQGKIWLYRQTPFGISRWEDKPAEQTAVAERPTAVIKDLGDRIEFQRQTPFGVSKWATKKTELTDEEKALIAASADPRTSARIEKSTEKQEKQ